MPRKPKASAASAPTNGAASPFSRPRFDNSDVFTIEKFAEAAIRCPAVPDVEPDKLAAWAFAVGQACLRQSRSLEFGEGNGEPIPAVPGEPLRSSPPELTPGQVMRARVLLRFEPKGPKKLSDFADLGDEGSDMLEDLLSLGWLEHHGLTTVKLTLLGDTELESLRLQGHLRIPEGAPQS